MKSTGLYSLLAASISLSLYGPNAISSDALPVLAETETRANKNEGLLLERTQIKSTPVANNTLSQLLKIQPGIAINDANGSVRNGDLAPEEISLANARTHQTNYMIGGVTTNNVTTFAADDKAGALGGHTSGYFFDTPLLESVAVMDRNVSAEYGGFTGGIINAELRKPTDIYTAEYLYRMTDSGWNSDPTLDDDNSDFKTPAWGDGRYQDKYQKRFHNLFVAGPVNDHHKLGFGLTVQESDIPLLYNGQHKDHRQTNTNAFINHAGSLGSWTLDNELRFSKFTQERFLNDTFTDATDEFSDYKNKHSGVGFTLKLARAFALGKWRSTVAFDQLNDERSAGVNYFKTHLDFRQGFKMGSSGSYGNLEQTQNSTKLKTAFDFHNLYTGDVRHQFSVGADATLHSAKGTFHKDFNTFFQRSNPNDTVKLDNWVITKAGNYKADAKQYALYATNTLDWSRLTVNLGLRAERIDLFSQTALAPRFTTTWDFDTDRTHRLGVGASRYYSGSLLGWALNAKKRGMQSNLQDCVASGGGDNIRLNPDDYTCKSITQYQPYDLNQADAPYADEFTLNYDLQLANVKVGAAYLYRQQRDGLSLIGNDRLQNNIESESNIYSLRVSNVESLQFLRADINSYLNLGYLDAKGSGSTSAIYNDQNNLHGGTLIDWVELDGQLMRRSEMDTGSYNSDVTAALGFNAQWKQQGVTWNNLFNYEAGRKLTLFERQKIETINGEPTAVSVLSSADMDSLITWNSQLTWTPPIANEQLTLGLTVTNLLNKQVKISTSGIKGKSRFTDDYYSKGREVWLSVGARL